MSVREGDRDRYRPPVDLQCQTQRDIVYDEGSLFDIRFSSVSHTVIHLKWNTMFNYFSIKTYLLFGKSSSLELPCSKLLCCSSASPSLLVNVITEKDKRAMYTQYTLRTHTSPWIQVILIHKRFIWIRTKRGNLWGSFN